MGETVALITPVRDRHSAMPLCERWVSRQTLSADLWVVVDDGKDPVKLSMGQLHVKRKPCKKRITTWLNLIEGFRHAADADIVLILEDDDWRSPRYVERLVGAVKSHDISVMYGFRYYHVRQRMWKSGRDDVEKAAKVRSRLSFHCAMRRPVLSFLVDVLSKQRPKNRKLSHDFWDYAWENFRVNPITSESMVAIKGIRGYSATVGHKNHFGGQHDPGGYVLKNWVGMDDARLILKAGSG